MRRPLHDWMIGRGSCSPPIETGYRMCTTKQSLAPEQSLVPERWAGFFDRLVASGSSSLVAVGVVRERAAEQREGTKRTLRAIGYDADRDVLELASGALDETDAGVLRYFIHQPLAIAVEDLAQRGELWIVVSDATGVCTRIRLYAQVGVKARTSVRRATCGGGGRARRKPRTLHSVNTTSATARRACRQSTSA